RGTAQGRAHGAAQAAPGRGRAVGSLSLPFRGGSPPEAAGWGLHTRLASGDASPTPLRGGKTSRKPGFFGGILKLFPRRPKDLGRFNSPKTHLWISTAPRLRL